jgi:hypothetical protein
MANGFDILSETDWKLATQDQKELWTFRMLTNMNKEIKKLKCWATPKIICGSMIGGALTVLVMVIFKFKVF